MCLLGKGKGLTGLKGLQMKHSVKKCCPSLILLSLFLVGGLFLSKWHLLDYTQEISTSPGACCQALRRFPAKHTQPSSRSFL